MKKIVKRKESILSIREKKLAYSLVLPTMILVLSIVIIPLLANFWISFKISLGGLKSPSEIGLKDIQKFAKSGIITIDKTKIIVGKIKE